jgi:uncharacterized protein YcbK (DUF882 family)
MRGRQRGSNRTGAWWLVPAACCALTLGGPAWPRRALAQTAPGGDKKTQLLAAKETARAQEDEAARARRRKAWQRKLAARTGKPAPHPLNLYNTWTHETLAVDPDETTLPGPLVDRFLRCHYTNQATSMDPRLVGVILGAARHFRIDRVHIVSGYRAPKYNLILRKKGHEVARNSQHSEGNAVDFRLPRIAVRRLHRWAVALRLGGVGFYRKSAFIHVDTGRIRYWNGR